MPAAAAEDGIDQFIKDLKTLYGAMADKLGGQKEAEAEVEAEPESTQAAPNDKEESDAFQTTPETEPVRRAPLYDPTLVAAIQRGLTDHGYSPGRPDGVFGSRTQSAIREFQTRQGLVVDGQPTPELLASLEALPTPEARKSTAPAVVPAAEPAADPTADPATKPAGTEAESTLPPVTDLTEPEPPAPLDMQEPTPSPGTPPTSETAAEQARLPNVDTLSVDLGMTTEEATRQEPELRFRASSDPGGIKRLSSTGTIESASYLALLERGHISFQFRADPFAGQIYWIQRLVDLGQEVDIEEIRTALIEKYGEPKNAAPRRLCWGQCDPSARILSHAGGQSVSMELSGSLPSLTHGVRMVMWDGSVAARARNAADAAIAPNPTGEPVTVDRVIDSL